jgi:putative CocE/NonD family hydrolase
MRTSSHHLSGLLIVGFVGFADLASGQRLPLPAGGLTSDSAIAKTLPRLAREAIALYANPDSDAYLDNLARLEIVAGDFRRGGETLARLRSLRARSNAPKRAVLPVPYEVYAKAGAALIATDKTFETAFLDSYREVVGALDDRAAGYEVPWIFGTPLGALESNFRQSIGRLTGKTEIPLADAIDLIRRYLGLTAFRSMVPFIAIAQEQDDKRRYVVDKDVLVPTPSGARICVSVFRPRVSTRLPALLDFSVYVNSFHTDEARLSASRGYVGVTGFSRGKACSPDAPIPFEHDGEDAAAVIDWIARQSWSDGRVGMFGGSYDGFTQWAAAKHRPKALKAMMPSVTADPGLGFPMEGGVYMNYAYPYPFYVTNNKGLDDATYFDSDRWQRLNRAWYLSGRAYAALDSIDGTPNPLFRRWLAHPGYDKYWQRMSPYGDEFARIDIPVLTTTGYYDSGQEGALYYFNQHIARRPTAEHYLLIGPYDHPGGQRGNISPTGSAQRFLRGYVIDSVAQIEIPGRLRYEWFDYVFKGGQKPALLRDRVNYQVMGANVWKSAPSISAMGPRKLAMHPSRERVGTAYRLTEGNPPRIATVVQTVNLADRGDVDEPNIDQALDDWAIVDSATHLANALEFMSEPFADPVEISGLFSGRLDFVTNKKDFDLDVTLFEKTPAGEYFQLSYVWQRVSYARDRTRRQLLVPDRLQHIPFTSARLTSRRFSAGSRLVVVVSVIKQPGEQINYGTGGPVSRETIADAGAPLRIEWRTSSEFLIPITQPAK